MVWTLQTRDKIKLLEIQILNVFFSKPYFSKGIHPNKSEPSGISRQINMFSKKKKKGKGKTQVNEIFFQVSSSKKFLEDY